MRGEEHLDRARIVSLLRPQHLHEFHGTVRVEPARRMYCRPAASASRSSSRLNFAMLLCAASEAPTCAIWLPRPSPSGAPNKFKPRFATVPLVI
jgi:hypothetical protein